MPPQYSGTTNPEDPTFSHSRTAEWFATLGMESVQAMNESESSPANLRSTWPSYLPVRKWFLWVTIKLVSLGVCLSESGNQMSRVVHHLLNALYNHHRVHTWWRTGRLECRVLEGGPRPNVFGSKEAEELAAGGEFGASLHTSLPSHPDKPRFTPRH